MKSGTYAQTAEYLTSIFDMLNKDFFAGELKRPVITIQSTPKAYGHFYSRADAWNTEAGQQYEINIGAGTLNRSLAETIATLIHEMVHYYNAVHNVKDTSRGGTYHSKAFKTEAEKHGIRISYDKKIGWSVTEPGEEITAFISRHKLQNIGICRNDENGAGKKKKKSNSRKYECPCCGMSVRATKAVRVMCMDCETMLVDVTPDQEGSDEEDS